MNVALRIMKEAVAVS